MMNFENQYRRLNEPVAPSGVLSGETLRRMKQAQERGSRRRRILRRITAAAAAAVLAVGCGAPALAANVSGAYEMMYAVSPAAAQFFMPVNEVCEDQGVRMEVISAAVYGDTAEIYLTMHDINGTLFDGGLDLFDSYSLHVPVRSGQSCGCTLTDFDAEARTATFLIEIVNMENEPFRGGKYTFSVRSLLTGKQVLEDTPILDSLTGIPLEPATERLDAHGGSCDPKLTQMPDTENGYDFLCPQGTIWQSGDGVFALTAAGYRDNRLHLLFRTEGGLAYDNHGWFTLYGADGTKRDPAYTVLHRASDADTSYTEYVFDVPYDGLERSRLAGCLYTSSTRIDGDWRVTFTVK